MKVATADERLGIDRPFPKKPILKHRTLSEMLTIPMPSSPILEAVRSGDDDDDDFDPISGRERPILMQTKSDTNIFHTRTAGARKRSPPRQPRSGKSTPGGRHSDGGHSTPPDANHNGKRHISFNTFVEQVIAIDEAEHYRRQQESDSDEDMLEMKSNSSRSSRPSLSSSTSAEHVTIAKIAPTMLKANGAYGMNMPSMVYAPPPEYQSPPLVEPPSSNQMDFPSPTTTTTDTSRNRWQGEDDDDEYGSVGFDYFGGPHLAGDDQQYVQPTHVGTSYAPGAPTVNVNAPPSQPKWRSGQMPPSGSEPSSISSSSSNSLNNNNVTSSPVPSRGILKVRPPGTTPPEPSSPPTYFNYNPSAATGIGGMRGSLDYPAVIPGGGAGGGGGGGGGGSSGVAVATSSEEIRGRSASRDRGSSAFDRSSSRLASGSSSTSSVSPGATCASPVDPTARRSSAPGVGLSTSPPFQLPSPTIQQGVQVPPTVAQNMDVDENEPYAPERSDTPTPHSSPQVS